jgi:hypothetical protein
MLLAKLHGDIPVVIMRPTIFKDSQARNKVSSIYRTFQD